MINETKIAIEYLTELRDSRQKVLPNEAPYYEAEKDMDIFNLAIKALKKPQGEWLILNGDKVCPFCRTGTNHNTNASIIFFHYCPYCGADLRVKDELNNELNELEEEENNA